MCLKFVRVAINAIENYTNKIIAEGFFYLSCALLSSSLVIIFSTAFSIAHMFNDQCSTMFADEEGSETCANISLLIEYHIRTLIRYCMLLLSVLKKSMYQHQLRRVQTRTNISNLKNRLFNPTLIV